MMNKGQLKDAIAQEKAKPRPDQGLIDGLQWKLDLLQSGGCLLKTPYTVGDKLLDQLLFYPESGGW